MTGDSPGQPPFQAHVDVLNLFLGHRKPIVNNIQDLLNAQRRPVQFLMDRRSLAAHLDDCFLTLPDVSGSQSQLKKQLEEAHRSSGFRPRQVADLHNDVVDPAEMMIRGFHCWRQTRWPGRNGRVRYAHTVFDLYLLRWLELLSLRLWEAGSGTAGDRLAEIQAVLDALWSGNPSDLPVLVRDARWLIPLAQSPTTDELSAYFEVAEQVDQTLEPEDRVEIQKAHLQMIGGHLRSQIRHYCITDGVSLDERSVVLRTRTSNALDFALVIQGLVSLLETYQQARDKGDEKTRLEMADAIYQAISPDPELFLNRVELLGAYSMIEHLFVRTDDDGRVSYTQMGQRHIGFVNEYRALISRLAGSLHEDCSRFRPVDGRYSPYGAIFGTPTNLIEDMALKTLQLDAVPHLGLEDVFTAGDADKLAWVSGWRKLPHVDIAVQKLYEYPQQFAADMFDRIEREFARCVAGSEINDDSGSGRLYVLADGDPAETAKVAGMPELSVRYIGSSDGQFVAEQKAGSYEQAQLLRHRQEGYFLVSFKTRGGWLAIKKDLLTEVIGAGQDVKLELLPPEAAAVLYLMCPGLVQTSMPPSILNA